MSKTVKDYINDINKQIEKFREKQLNDVAQNEAVVKQIEETKLPLDEVAAAYIATLRVENYTELSYEFGGYKIGAIYSYILKILNESIYEFNSTENLKKKAFFQNIVEKVGK